MAKHGLGQSTSLPTLILTLFLLGVCHPSVFVEDSSGYYPDDRSELVRFDISSVRYDFTPWGSLYFGEVNRTTELSFRLMNNNGAPFSDVRINLTVYWFDGTPTDRLRVMHTDSKKVDVDAGIGARSELVTFEWTPQFAGSYMWNLSAFVPNDPFPVSDTLYGFGKNYTTSLKKVIYNGFWVGTYHINCSDMSGWSSESQGGLPDMKWHVSSHPLALDDPTQHSAGKVFWVGNETTGMGPTSGVYSIVSPRFDLSRFDESPYSPDINKGKPQIYLLYKYRGQITSSEPAGMGAAIYHYISTDDGLNWERLIDPHGDHVNITGTTTSPIWNHVNHTSVHGGSTRWGLDLSGYQGRTVRIKLEYRPSGHEETGFLIDDIALEGKERVDISTFNIVGRSSGPMTVEPGDRVSFWADVRSVPKESGQVIRTEAVYLPYYIDPEDDLDITPMAFPAGPDTIRVEFTIKVPSGAPSGHSTAAFRLIGKDTVRNIWFAFDVQAFHDLDISLNGQTDGTIGSGSSAVVYLGMVNRGNIGETLHVTFVTADGLRWDQSSFKSYDLSAGEEVQARYGISSTDDKAGTRTGFLVWSVSDFNIGADEVLSMVLNGPVPSEWTVRELSYRNEEVHDVSIFSSVTMAVINDPPEDGEKELIFNLNLLNNGNADERVHLVSALEKPEVNITVSLPKNITLGARVLDTVVQVVAVVSFPISSGTYRFQIEAVPDSLDDPSDNSVELSIRIGSEEIVNGMFIANSSVGIAPEVPILGSETVISFDVHSFGLPDNTPFFVVLRTPDTIESRSEFFTSRIGRTLCQMRWIPEERGKVNLSLGIEGAVSVLEKPGDLVTSVNISVMVRYIDIGLEWAGSPINETPPGTKYFIVIARNEGDVKAELITVVLNLTSNTTRTFLLNITGLDPAEESLLRFGPLELEEETVYSVYVETPEEGRWKDANSSNNRVFTRVVVGPHPPGEPFWRGPAFLIASCILFAIIAVAIFILLYRRR